MKRKNTLLTTFYAHRLADLALAPIVSLERTLKPTPLDKPDKVMLTLMAEFLYEEYLGQNNLAMSKDRRNNNSEGV